MAWDMASVVAAAVADMRGKHQHEEELPEEEDVDGGTNPLSRTIIASDNEVSNGFVKDGKRLPYVFEASEPGSRKRSSKILPVCGVCGKRFVCVTTMKRHLVTHTGEKPFSCKICGKQYTQKGNLRVHERTHRNDRPFECNICHQKFYRKEPMQKHQWRQHGVVHFRSRPSMPPPAAVSAVSAAPAYCPAPSPTLAVPTATSVGLLYHSLVDRIRQSSAEALGDSRHVAAPMAHDEDSAHHHPVTLPKLLLPSFVVLEHKFQQQKQQQQDLIKQRASEALLPRASSPFGSALRPNLHLLTSFPEGVSDPPPEQPESREAPEAPHRPIKLKKLLAHAYLREVEELKDREVEAEAAEAEDDGRGGGKELVECQCKACGSVFSVQDPFNFRCSKCNSKYTSLPTHMIAEPLQCIGCCHVFAHKPALKAHQTGEETERPFKCCKCGYSFRQKAHLQKHQWRIHRRRLEPEAESYLPTAQSTSPPRPPSTSSSSSSSSPSPSSASSGSRSTLTLQDIIDQGVERGMPSSPADASAQPLDLSPSKCASRPLLRQLVSSLPALRAAEPSRMSLLPQDQLLRLPTLPVVSGEEPFEQPRKKLRPEAPQQQPFKHSTWLSAAASSMSPSDHDLHKRLSAIDLTTTTRPTTSTADLVKVQLERLSCSTRAL